MDKPLADIMWVLLSAGLVFMMQAGFLCLETGLTRSKNNINVALKNLADFGVAALLFWGIGFGLMFGASWQGWLGLNHFALPAHDTWLTVFFFFQVMFCGTAVTILAGAVAERMRFGAYLLATLIVSGLIYPIFGHWAWNGLDSGASLGWLAASGFVDFAGSTVVHSVGGWVALAAVLLIGPRVERFPTDRPPRKIPGANVPLATLGILLLWFGWFGFNAGSTLELNAQVPAILLNTMLAGAAGLIMALAFAERLHGYADVGWTLNGGVAGLVAITANCHVVGPLAAVIIGAIGGLVMLLADWLLARLRIDDAVGAIPAHLGAGIWGTLAVALFGDLGAIGTGLDRWSQLLVQGTGVLVCGVWSFGVAYVVLFAIKQVYALRVNAEEEHIGLNVVEHQATTELLDLFTAMEKQSSTQDLSMRVPVEPFTEVGQIARRYNTVMDALEHAMARTDAIVKTAVDSIITVSRPDLRISSVNPAAEAMFGQPQERLLNRCVTDLLDLDPVPTRDGPPERPFHETLAEIVASGQAREFIGRRADGSTFPLEVMVTEATVGTEHFYTGIFRDTSARKEAEEAVRQSQELLQAVIDNVPAAVFVKNTQGRYRLVNRYLASSCNLTPAQMVGRMPADFFPVENLEAWRHYEEAVLQTGEPVEYEEEIVVADGLRTNLVILFPLHNAQGLVHGLGGIATDITARKQAEETLRRQKRYSEALLSNSPVAIVTLDMDAVVTGWNPAAERLFGYTSDEAAGRLIYDMVAANEDIHADASGYAQRVRDGECIQTISQRTRKDGTLIDVEMLAVPVVVDNRQVGMIVIYHDITELQGARKEAEAASQAKSTFLATMSHEIRTPLNAIIGMSGLLLDTPLAAEQYEFTETIRTSSNALLSVINDILDFSKIEAGRLELDTQPFDLRDCLEEALDLIAPRAAEKHLDIAYLLDEAAPLAVAGDMPRLRQILINLLSNAVKFTMQGEVVVSVSATVLKQGRDAVPPLYELHFAVRDTGIGIPPERMDRLFKSFSQVDASTTRQFGGTGLGLVISKRLAELMNGTMWVESAGVPGQGSTFHFTIHAHAAPASPARARLHQQQPQLRGKRLIIVDDNATNRRILQLQARSWGMLAFETSSPYEALDWVRRGDPFDVGILDMQMPEMDGLMLAAAIRREPIAHELPLVMLTSLGQRDDENEEAQAYFAAYLTKPIKASQLYNVLVDILESDETPVMREQTRSEGPSAFNAQMADEWPLRMLLAEDNSINQRLVMLMLERLGYQIDIVANGAEALDAVQHRLYDVVLMDMQMPEMDGLEATRRIRAEVPATRQPHIIALTANALQGDREACLQAGMDDYLSKPIEVDALVMALRRVSPHLHLSEAAPAPPAPAPAVSAPPEVAEAAPDEQDAAPDAVEVAPLIDPVAIERLTDTLGKQAALLLPDLIDAFCNDAMRLQAQARQTFDAGDSAGLRRAAHTLKSNSANFGVVRLTALCQQLEDTARNGDLSDTTSDLLDQVATAYEQACPALEALRQHVQ